MKSKKVAHITTVDMALRYLLLNQLLAIQNASYEVIAISAPGENVSFLRAAGIYHVSVPMTRNFTPLQDIVSLWRLYWAIKKESPMIVHTHNAKPGLLGQLAARLAGVPIVVNTVHGFYFHDNMKPLKRRFYITFEKLAARCSDVILSQNGEDIETAVHEGICPRHKIKELGNGIDVSRFDRARLSAGEVALTRAQIGLPDEALVVGFVGRLVREKGLVELFEAAAQVRKVIPDVHFLFIGPVDVEKPDALTPKSAEVYGIADISHFLGMRQDMPALYALMDVFALPSYREGFPRAPMEASAMGVPCVVTDIRGCREAVEQDKNGLLVPPRCLSALVKSIVDLLQDPDRRHRMADEGRQMALRLFDEQVVFARVIAEYDHLLQSKRILCHP